MATVDRRLVLDAKLRDILGNNHTYYQPPESVKMEYPCIRYERSKIDIVHADNIAYLGRKRYTLTLIYFDPDSDLPDQLMNDLPVVHDRHYTADNLNHDVFTLYF